MACHYIAKESQDVFVWLAFSQSFLQSDLQHGEGKFTSPDGTLYEGEWRSGKKHGQGKIRFSSGNAYEGQFENDVMHGQGVFNGTCEHL